MTRARPSRRAPSGRSPLFVVLVALVVLAASFAGLATSAVSMQTNERTVGTDVVDDAVGILGLEVAETVTIGKRDRLLDVTNRLQTDVTVTIGLHASATDKGELVVDGVPQGNTTSFTLSAGSTRQIDIDVVDGQEQLGEEISFDVTASAPGTFVETPGRATTIDEGG